MNKEYFKNTNDIIGRSDHKLLIDNKSYFDTVQKNYHDFTYNLESNVDISSFNISQCLKDGQKYKCFHNNLNHKEGKKMMYSIHYRNVKLNVKVFTILQM